MKTERKKAWQVEKRSSSHEGGEGGGHTGQGKMAEGQRAGQRECVEGRKEGKGGGTSPRVHPVSHCIRAAWK